MAFLWTPMTNQTPSFRCRGPRWPWGSTSTQVRCGLCCGALGWGGRCSSCPIATPAPMAVTDVSPLPAENDTIYWVDMGLSTISRAKRDQTWREDVVTNGIGRVEGIAVDWIAGEWGLH